MSSSDVTIDVQESKDKDLPRQGRQCRICLEDEDDDQERRSTNPLISPCRCAGTQRWVHRKCLDEWRATNPDHITFSQCNECLANYKMKYVGPSAGMGQYCCYVTRDIGLGCTVFLLTILGFGWIVWITSATYVDDTTTLVGISINASNTGLLVLAYFVTGLIIFLVLLGICGICIFSTNECSLDQTMRSLEVTTVAMAPSASSTGARQQESINAPQSLGMDRNVSVNSTQYSHELAPVSTSATPATVNNNNSSNNCNCNCTDCHHYCDGNCLSSCVDDCGRCCRGDCWCCSGCDCPSGGDGGGGSSSGGDGDAFLAVFLLLIVAFLATVGLVVGVFISILLIQRILARHMFRLQRKRLTHTYVVLDLSNRSPPPRAYGGQDLEAADDVELPPPLAPPTDATCNDKLPPSLPPREELAKCKKEQSESLMNPTPESDDEEEEILPHWKYLEKLGLVKR